MCPPPGGTFRKGTNELTKGRHMWLCGGGGRGNSDRAWRGGECAGLYYYTALLYVRSLPTNWISNCRVEKVAD